MTTTVIGRGRALRCIGDAIADRTAFVVVIPPGLVDEAAGRLAEIDPGWTAYLDHGRDIVLATDEPAGPVVLALIAGVPLAAVVTVPKTVPAEQLGAALGQDVPDDGSRDLVVIHDDTGQLQWPLLFLDALARVDPAAAAQIRADSVAASN